MAADKFNLNNIDKSNWKSYRFDEIAINISERVDPNNTDLEVYIGLEHIDSESLHIKRTGTPDDVNGQKLKFYKGDIIFGRRRAYQRKAGIATCDGFCSAHALVLRANTDVIDIHLFPFFMHSDAFMNRAVDISVGSLSPTINWGTLKYQEFLVPPKEQQAKLAELLWAMDEVIERDLEVLDCSSKLKRAIRRKLNEGELKRYLGSQVTTLITKGASPKWQGFDYCASGTLFVTSENVLDGALNLIEKKYLPLPFNEKQKRSQLKNEDVLINIVGASIGRVAVFDIDIESANINQAVCLFRTDKTYARPKYIMHYLLEDANNKRLVNQQSATARPNLSLKDMSDFEFYLPNLEKQDEFLFKIHKSNEMQNAIEYKISASKVLQKSLINEVF